MEEDRLRLARDVARLPEERAGRRSGTRGPCCGGSSAPGRPRRRTRAAGCAPRRPCPARPRRSAGAATPSAPSTPSCSADAAACRSWPTWRRSVSRRSPSAHARIRSGRRSPSVIVSVSDATPRRAEHRAPSRAGAGGRPPSRRRRRRRPARPTSRGSRSAPPRGPGSSEAGRSIASSRRSHSRAGPVAKTLPAPLITAGIADRVERVADQRGVAVGPDEHRRHAPARPAPDRPRRRVRRGARAPRLRTAAGRRRRRGPRRCARGPTRWSRYPPRVSSIVGSSRHSIRTPQRRLAGRSRAGGAAGWPAAPGPCGRRFPGGRASHPRTSRRRRRSGPGRCAS